MAKPFSKALHAVDISAPSPVFDDLQGAVARVLGIEEKAVFVTVFPSAAMVAPLLTERMPTKCRLLLGIVMQSDELEAATQVVSDFICRTNRLDAAAMCVLSSYGDWYIANIICRGGDGIGARIKDVFSPSAKVVPPTPAPAAATRGPGSGASALIMDERILRMARLAIASSSAIIFVGPPGTGKTTIVKKLLQEVAYNPAAFGMTRAPKEAKWVTPSAGWRAADLLGGEAEDEKGRRRFALGHVLEAIRQDRWLVLDEANRANMDMIFGGLLTWLSDQKVELGRASADFTAPPVVLDWNDKPESQTIRLELLDADKIVSSDPIKFLAGQDWRLLGTYNAQDAAKVFTFGQALGRRFVRVPIPAIGPKEFKAALAPLVKDLPPEVGNTIAGIYATHRASKSAQLGPAIFLRMAAYVAAGLKLTQLTNVAVVTKSGLSTSTDTIMQLVAEAYLSSAGIWLAQQSPDDLDAFGKAIQLNGLPEPEWQWVRDLIPTLI